MRGRSRDKSRVSNGSRERKDGCVCVGVYVYTYTTEGVYVYYIGRISFIITKCSGYSWIALRVSIGWAWAWACLFPRFALAMEERESLGRPSLPSRLSYRFHLLLVVFFMYFNNRFGMEWWLEQDTHARSGAHAHREGEQRNRSFY